MLEAEIYTILSLLHASLHLLPVAGCRPALHLAIIRKDLVSTLMLISPGFFKGEGPEIKEVFTELRDLFLETNEKVQSGLISKNHPGRIVESVALHAYINYTFGQCLNEEQAEFEMDRVSLLSLKLEPTFNRWIMLTLCSLLV